MNLFKKLYDMVYDEKGDEIEVGGGIYDDKDDDEINNTPALATRPLTEEAVPANDYNSNVSVSSGTSIEMKVIRPEKLDSVTQIADFLTSGNTVLLNLESTNKETSRRLLDFLNGVAYAVGGKVKKVANSTYVITPSNVSISGGQASDTAEHEAI